MANIILPNEIPENRRMLHEWKTKRLKSGLHLPEYRYIAIPGYWRGKQKPISFEEVVKGSARHQCIWELENWDANTGELHERSCHHNVITDNGGISLLKNLWNNAGSAIAIMSHVVVSPNGACAKLTAATGVSPITSLSISALTAALANGATLTLGYNGATPQTVTLSALAAALATSLTVTSFTPSANFPIGTDICAIPSVTDNPSSVSGTVDSGALAGGAFTFLATSGLGNRQVTIVATITGTSGNAGTYTEAYTSNNATIGTGTTASHIIIPGFVLNSSTNETLTLVEKC
ncbi:MAG TPA: hypothetical protein VHV10_02835 [Ktedonobacteraceae bacterium]|jgi:hypothetical protein|nr:hypothetical protein [Ktedonobacteraceae bacterium]